MGLFSAVTNYAHKAELRESKDEIVVGELIRGLSHRGWTMFQLVAHSDRQQMGFKIPGDPVISRAFILVDRRTGSGALTAGLGSKTTVRFAAEMRHLVADPVGQGICRDLLRDRSRHLRQRNDGECFPVGRLGGAADRCAA